LVAQASSLRRNTWGRVSSMAIGRAVHAEAGGRGPPYELHLDTRGRASLPAASPCPWCAVRTLLKIPPDPPLQKGGILRNFGPLNLSVQKPKTQNLEPKTQNPKPKTQNLMES